MHLQLRLFSDCKRTNDIIMTPLCVSPNLLTGQVLNVTSKRRNTYYSIFDRKSLCKNWSNQKLELLRMPAKYNQECFSYQKSKILSKSCL